MINIELTGYEISIISANRNETKQFKELYGNAYVYFLLHENEIVYIGCSSSVFARMNQHKAKIYYLEEKIFDKVIMFQYKNKSLAMTIEKYFISIYKPKYNGAYYPVKFFKKEYLDTLSNKDRYDGEHYFIKNKCLSFTDYQ